MSFDIHHLAKQGRITRPVELRNIVAILPGRSSRRIYITAHYDTVNIGPRAQIASNTQPPGVTVPDAQLNPAQDYNAPAPGADDNGSGTALTMELARVFAESGIDFDATLVFALWAGEEQGLFGSRAHAQRLQQDERRRRCGLQQRHRRWFPRRRRQRRCRTPFALYAQGPEDSMSRSLARYHREGGRRLRSVAPGPADGARRSVQPLQRSHSAFTQRGFAGRRLPGVEGELFETARQWRTRRTASTSRISPRTRG